MDFQWLKASFMVNPKLIHITDLHFGDSADSVLAGINPLDSFNAVLDAIDENGFGEELLLLSGDLSGVAHRNSYKMLNRLLKNRNKQVAWLPGNHDRFSLMEKYLDNFPFQRVTDLGNWAVLSLDSSQLSTPAGHLSGEELLCAERFLSNLRDRPVLISMHHCPIPIGSSWLDKHKIDNAEDLYSILTRHENIKGVITGHVHQKFEGLWGKLPLYTTPSSCIQFKQGSDIFGISSEPPGYRWFDLNVNGNFTTGVAFASEFNQLPNVNSSSY
jgi:Icc protein